MLWRIARLLFIGCLAASLGWGGPAVTFFGQKTIPDIAVTSLPPEAVRTLALIQQGGPYPYKRDGIVFQNREKRLPERGKGYYREYTVPTPGERGRGAKRIVAGTQGEFYYTADHYKTFQRIRQ